MKELSEKDCVQGDQRLEGQELHNLLAQLEGDWQLVADSPARPRDHGPSGAMTLSPDGTPLLSDCLETCRPYPGRFPQYSADGAWIVAGGTLTHRRTGSVRVLDPVQLPQPANV